MSDRTHLIERAAARLPGATDPVMTSRALPEPTAPVSSLPPRVRPALPQLRRQVALNVSRLAQTGIVMPWTSSARVAEEFRIIKRNIMASWQPNTVQATQPPRVIMVTSARPREGKTFTSINLALAFAAEPKSVTVLIDADTVRSDTAHTLDVPAAPGLTDVLTREVSLSDALIQTDLANLVVLPPGSYGPHIPELLAGDAPQLMVSEIIDRYPNHVIIMDTPPCLASTDPTALAAIATQIVFVVEATHTQKEEVEAALNLVSACANISLVLNQAPAGTSDHFGSYSYYYQPAKT